jgi:hypothetical protein
METQVDEIAAGVYRRSTYTDAVAGGFTFNQFRSCMACAT